MIHPSWHVYGLDRPLARMVGEDQKVKVWDQMKKAAYFSSKSTFFIAFSKAFVEAWLDWTSLCEMGWDNLH